MDGINRKTAKGAIARHLRSITALCMFAAPLAAFSSGCDAGGASNEKVAEANEALKACVTLPATGDAMITVNPKNQTWGSHPLLRVGGNDESLLKFDLSSIPAEASVDSATLKLYTSSVNGTNPVQIHAANQAWTESTVSYTSFNQQFETAVSALLDPNVATTYKTADVKSLVNRWRSGAKANNGILLTRAGNDKAQFTSRDGSAGFGPTLTVCYTLIEDLCAAGPCAHGACTNGDPTYTCACDPGWTGTNCDINIDECAGNPCLNGSTCTDGVNGYTCACAPGYTGTNCETDIDECAADPCQHGICTDQINAYSCACDPGFAGTNCEINIDECAGAPCQNGATCADGVNGYSCACDPGFTGTNCEINIDECAATPCQNGDCIDGINAYTCACLPGFAGANCDVNIDECAGSPCLNGGACSDGIFSYTCDCAAGYTGANCEVDIDDCAAAPCQNGGLCVDGVNSYTCQCAPGWTGTNCDEPVTATCPCEPDFTAVRDAVLALGGVDQCSLDPAFAYMLRGNGSGAIAFGVVSAALNGTNACAAGDGDINVDVYKDGLTDAELAACLALMPASCPNINPCAAFPCQNDGFCTPTADYLSYACECQPGWTGTNCDQPAGATCPCDGEPLWDAMLSADGWPMPIGSYDGPTGISYSSVYNGDLYPYMGYVVAAFNSTPSEELDGYASAPPYSACSVMNYSGLLMAHTGISDAEASACGDEIRSWITHMDGCTFSPCQNGGYCSPTWDSYVCECDLGFTGTNCEINIDECEPAPCLNGGTCVDGLNSYTCECLPGWAGTNCDQPAGPTCPCGGLINAIHDDLLANISYCSGGGDPPYLLITATTPDGTLSAGVTSGPSPWGPTAFCGASDHRNGGTVESSAYDITAEQAAACLALLPATCPQ